MHVGETDSAVEDYLDRGFAVLTDITSESVLRAVEAVLDERERHWEAEVMRMPGRRSWISRAGEITFTARLAGTEPVLRDLITSEVLLGFLTSVLGAHIRLYFDQAVYKKPRCPHAVPWHQDDGYNPKVPSDYVTFWIPLTNTTVDNGTIRVQPGRHHEGPLPHHRSSDGYLVCDQGSDGGLPVELRRGDALAFSSLIPHSTGPNRTSTVRKAYIATCVPDGTQLKDGTPCDHPVNQPLLSSKRDPPQSTDR